MSEDDQENVSILLVEPELFSQLMVLDAVHDSHARVDVTCVSTCGGALSAIDAGNVECLVLSTNLARREDERRGLAALLRVARSLGLAVLSIGDAEPGCLGVALHESLDVEDVVCGRLNAALERACARAAAERALLTLAQQDRLALSGRARLLPLATQPPAYGELEQNAVDLDALLDRTLELATTISGINIEEQRRFESRLSLAADECLLGQLLLNIVLALLRWQPFDRAKLISSAFCFEREVMIEINAPHVQLPENSAAMLVEPFGEVDGAPCLGLWVTRHLLARWGARLELGAPAGGGTSFLVAFPASLRRRSSGEGHALSSCA